MLPRLALPGQHFIEQVAGACLGRFSHEFNAHFEKMSNIKVGVGRVLFVLGLNFD